MCLVVYFRDAGKRRAKLPVIPLSTLSPGLGVCRDEMRYDIVISTLNLLYILTNTITDVILVYCCVFGCVCGPTVWRMTCQK